MSGAVFSNGFEIVSEAVWDETVIRYDSLRPDFTSLADWLTDLSEEGVWQVAETNILLFNHRPDKGSAAYEATLFPPITEAELRAIEAAPSFKLPAALKDLLLAFNGGRFGEIDVLGAIEKVDRTQRMPLQLSMGPSWQVAYSPSGHDGTLFAIENVSYEGQVGYFMAEDGSVTGKGNGAAGSPASTWHWQNPNHWLQDRLDTKR